MFSVFVSAKPSVAAAHFSEFKGIEVNGLIFQPLSLMKCCFTFCESHVLSSLRKGVDFTGGHSIRRVTQEQRKS